MGKGDGLKNDGLKTLETEDRSDGLGNDFFVVDKVDAKLLVFLYVFHLSIYL